MLKISHQNTFYFLRYAHMRYVKSLFTKIQKKSVHVKNQPTLLEIYKPDVQITREFLGLRMRNFQGIVLYENKVVGGFSNLL